MSTKAGKNALRTYLAKLNGSANIDALLYYKSCIIDIPTD